MYIIKPVVLFDTIENDKMDTKVVVLGTKEAMR